MDYDPIADIYIPETLTRNIDFSTTPKQISTSNVSWPNGRKGGAAKMTVTTHLAKIALLAALLFPASLAAEVREPVSLQLILLSSEYRLAVAKLVKKFNDQQDEITLSYRVNLNEKFHSERTACLKQDECPIDIFLGFSGYGFEQRIKRGKVEPIGDLWEQENFDDFFQNLKQSVTVEGQQYGIPLSYYPWGFFYNKTLFERHQLTPPKSWDEFLKICETLKTNGIPPIIIGTKTPFPAASWFSYLNLRLHGLDFHKKLTAGQISYRDIRVRETFKFWQNLIEKRYFLPNSYKETYLSVLPLLYRNIGGMYLIGNMILSKIPNSVRSKIGFFRFPQIKPSLPMFEEAPLDVLFIPKQSKHKKAAKKVLAFLAKPENQFLLNKAAGYLSPNLKSRQNKDRLLRITSNHLKSSNGFSYFFNRNSPPEVGRLGTKLLGRFVTDATDVDYFIEELEKLRLNAEKKRLFPE